MFSGSHVFTLPIAVVLMLIYPIRLPASSTIGFLFILSCLLALLIFTLLNFLVGTLALHIVSIMGVIRAKYAIVEFFSGLLIPISFFPAGLQRFMAFLPFPHVSFTPLQIYLGKVRGLAAWEALAAQGLWVLLLFAAGRVFWKFSTRKLSVQGG